MSDNQNEPDRTQAQAVGDIRSDAPGVVQERQGEAATRVHGEAALRMVTERSAALSEAIRREEQARNDVITAAGALSSALRFVDMQGLSVKPLMRRGQLGSFEVVMIDSEGYVQTPRDDTQGV